MDEGLKLATEECWHRTRSARDTIARILPLCLKFGITRLADVTGLDRLGIPVVLAIRPNSRSVAVSQGKGMNLEIARASGLMEAIELWHAETVAGPLWFGSYRELLADHCIIDLERMPPFADTCWTPDLSMHWIEGHDLISNRSVLVPFELVHMDMSSRSRPGEGAFRISSNGLASGNHPLEAACHAICELIERDALTVWHHRHRDYRARTRIDPTTFHNSQIINLWQVFERAGLAAAVFDVTSNIGVASILCVIATEHGHMGLGSGAHPDRRVAMIRALTEAAQTRMTYITGSRDDLLAAEFDQQGRQEKRAAAQSLLSLGTPCRSFGEVSTAVAPTHRADLDWLLHRLCSVGVEEVVIVDLARDPWQIPVARAIVPGLEAPHDEDGFEAGPRAQNAREYMP